MKTTDPREAANGGHRKAMKMIISIHSSKVEAYCPTKQQKHAGKMAKEPIRKKKLE